MNNFFKRRNFLASFILFSCLRAGAQTTDSLSIKIGQMLLIGFPKSELDSVVLQEIHEGKVGSIIFFEKNIPARNSFVGVKKMTWAYQKASPIPLLIGIDQEGGKVNRLKNKYGFPSSITAADMGKAGVLDSVRFYGESTASTLAGLGFNINFAPVVDLAINPDNPIIAKHGRAFSAREDSVILMAKEFINQHRKYGVLTSLKHFPGHGSSASDTHLGLVDITNTWSERELKPYEALINAGYADAIMTSHVVNRNLDKNGNPGTLSADILTGILRQRLHYNGVIITDDMQMQAVTKHYGFEEAIKMAIKAGVDIMTFSNNIAGADTRTVDRVQEVIRQLVTSGEISQARIDESFKRIMALKKKLQTGDQVAYYKQEFNRVSQQLEEKEEALKKAEALAKEPTTKKKKKKKNRS